jgi:hypothetical protein
VPAPSSSKLITFPCRRAGRSGSDWRNGTREFATAFPGGLLLAHLFIAGRRSVASFFQLSNRRCLAGDGDGPHRGSFRLQAEESHTNVSAAISITPWRWSCHEYPRTRCADCSFSDATIARSQPVGIRLPGESRLPRWSPSPAAACSAAPAWRCMHQRLQVSVHSDSVIGSP